MGKIKNKTMTKRAKKYFKAKRWDRVLSKLMPIVDSYQLTYLKIQQLKSKMLTPSEQLESHLEFTENELLKLIKP